jgi:hypothetical protein
MTPKEKAKELVDKFFEYSYRVKWDIDKNKWEHNFDQSKQCALIAVDEIIKASPLEPNDTPEWLQPEDWFPDSNISAEKYWQEVKIEIENL